MIIADINKEYVLSNIKEEDIISKYLNISVYDIIACYSYNQLMISPFRSDSKPSFGFKYIKGRLKYYDFGTNDKGDCFDIVGKCLGLNPNSNVDFVKILLHITNTFKLSSNCNGFFNEGNTINKEKELEIKKITISIRDYNNEDVKYFNSYGILHILQYLNVYPIESYTFDERKYNCKLNNPTYAIATGIKNNTNIIKIYSPKTKEFYTNHNIVHYHKLYTASEVLIITKSFKDVAVLIDLIKGRILNVTINFLYIPNENYLIDSIEMFDIKFKHDIIFTLFDYDNSGIHLSWLYRKIHNTIPLFITSGLWKRKQLYRYSKDISDYRRVNGKIDTLELINNKAEELYDIVLQNRKYTNGIREIVSRK